MNLPVTDLSHAGINTVYRVVVWVTCCQIDQIE